MRVRGRAARSTSMGCAKTSIGRGPRADRRQSIRRSSRWASRVHGPPKRSGAAHLPRPLPEPRAVRDARGHRQPTKGREAPSIEYLGGPQSMYAAARVWTRRRTPPRPQVRDASVGKRHSIAYDSAAPMHLLWQPKFCRRRPRPQGGAALRSIARHHAPNARAPRPHLRALVIVFPRPVVRTEVNSRAVYHRTVALWGGVPDR